METPCPSSPPPSWKPPAQPVPCPPLCCVLPQQHRVLRPPATRLKLSSAHSEGDGVGTQACSPWAVCLLLPLFYWQKPVSSPVQSVALPTTHGPCHALLPQHRADCRAICSAPSMTAWQWAFGWGNKWKRLSESLFSKCKPDYFCCRCMCGSTTLFTLKLLPWDLYLVSKSRY